MYYSDDKVELLDPPFNSEPGECIFVEGYEREIVGGKCNINSVIPFIHNPGSSISQGLVTRKLSSQ